MKLSLTILALIFFSAFKTDRTIYYVLDLNGKEIAKRFDNGKWEVRDAEKSLETLYREKTRVEKHYALAVAILKHLDANGNIADKKGYFQSVKAYNDR